MELRSKLFFTFFFLTAAPFVFGTNAPQTEQNSDALEMIAKRMQSLTHSLENLPQPPAFNQKIQLPRDFLPLPKSSNPTDEEVFLEKEIEA